MTNQLLTTYYIQIYLININLKRVNEIVKGNTIFGDYVFQTEMVDGIKTRTSDEVIERYKKII